MHFIHGLHKVFIREMIFKIYSILDKKSEVYVFSQKCSILQALIIIIYIKSFQWSYNINFAWCQDIQ